MSALSTTSLAAAHRVRQDDTAIKPTTATRHRHVRMEQLVQTQSQLQDYRTTAAFVLRIGADRTALYSIFAQRVNALSVRLA